MLVNGQPGDQIDATDRGLYYGDGLFETIAVRNGKTELWSAHMARLAEGCSRLGIAQPDLSLLAEEAAQLCADAEKAVLKIIITRGSGGRGYRAPEATQPTRLLQLHPWPAMADEATPFNLRRCRTTLGSNPALAGMKHLNRLEQVLARNEWNDESIQEGVMTDSHGNVIEGISSNLFAVRNGKLMTPNLSHSGVAGVMREKVLALAKELGIASEITTIHCDEMSQMDEIFMSNSILGIRPVARYEQTDYGDNPVTKKLMQALQAALEEEA